MMSFSLDGVCGFYREFFFNLQREQAASVTYLAGTMRRIVSLPVS
jgi:hypothetical protein